MEIRLSCPGRRGRRITAVLVFTVAAAVILRHPLMQAAGLALGGAAIKVWAEPERRGLPQSPSATAPSGREPFGDAGWTDWCLPPMGRGYWANG